jgi:hypothetical protein
MSGLLDHRFSIAVMCQRAVAVVWVLLMMVVVVVVLLQISCQAPFLTELKTIAIPSLKQRD